MIYKTYSGAAQRAQLERAYHPAPCIHTWVVIANDNSTQLAQGYAWRVKRIRRQPRPALTHMKA